MTIFIVYRNTIGGVQRYSDDLHEVLKRYGYNSILVKYNLTDNSFYPSYIKYRTHYEFNVNDCNIFETRKPKKLYFANDDLLIFSEAIEIKLFASIGFNGRLVYSVHGNSEHYRNTLFDYLKYLAGVITVNKLAFQKIKIEEKEVVPVLLPHLNSIPEYPVSAKKSIEIIYVGRLNRNKGVDLFIEVCSKIEGKKVLVTTEEELDSEFIKSINRIDNLTILFNLKNSSVIELLRDSKLYINPSSSEGFGITIVEAIKSGTIPIVMKGSVGPEEILSKHKYLIFSRINYIQGVLSIYSEIQNQGYYQNVVKSLQKHIAEQYDVNALIDRFISFIDILNSIPNKRIYSVNIVSKKIIYFKYILKLLWKKLV